MKKAFFIAFMALVGALTISCCSCRRGGSAIPLNGTTWALTEINGTVIDRAGNAERFTLTLDNDNRVSGMGDCNRIMGGYTQSATGDLSFNQAASTRMMCANQAMEDQFLSVINNTAKYRIDNRHLILMDSNNNILATFKAVE